MKVTINFAADSEKYVGRVNITCDEEFLKLDEQNNEVMTNTFSMDSYALELALREKCKEYRRAALTAPNSKLETGEIGMLLMGATLEIERSLKKAGDAREFGKGTYEKDTYTTNIVSVSINKEEAMMDELRASIRERKALSKMNAANPFGF